MGGPFLRIPVRLNTEVQARQPRQVTLWNPGEHQVQCTLAATEGEVRGIRRRIDILAAPCVLVIPALRADQGRSPSQTLS